MTLRNNYSKSTLVDLKKKSPGNIADVIPTARLTVFHPKYNLVPGPERDLRMTSYVECISLRCI